MVSQSESGAQPAPKRSLFKKSALAKPTEDDEGLSLFSRSKEIFPDVVAESERQRKNLERSRSNASVERTDHSVPKGKRRRTSKESEDSGDRSTDEEPARNDLKGRRTSHKPKPQPQSASLAATSRKRKGSLSPASKSYQHSIDERASRKSRTPQAVIISLSDSENVVLKTRNKDPMHQQVNLEADGDVADEILKPPKAVIPLMQDEPEEEDEFAEYVAKAREGARLKIFERLDSGMSHARLDSISSNGSTAKSETSNTALPVKATPPAPDPIVHILVSSVIQGTRPLILRRKLSQRLKDVRIAWCDKQVVDGQPVSEEIKRQIFLTWRKKRVWDLTTCKSMGLKVDPHGKLRSNGEGVNEEGQVHLEAWTEEIYSEYMKQQAAERKRRALDPMDEEEEEEPENEGLNAKNEVQKLRIMLKSKKYPEFKLMVSPSTLVSKLIRAFRSENKIAAEVEISLYLDGDKLEPASTVGDADIEEMTTIDVHVG